MLKPALIERAAAELDKLARVTGDGGPAMLVGSVFVRDGALLQRRRAARRRQGRGDAAQARTAQLRHLRRDAAVPARAAARAGGVPRHDDRRCRSARTSGTPTSAAISPNSAPSCSSRVNGSPYEIDKDALRIDGVAKRRAVDNRAAAGLPQPRRRAGRAGVRRRQLRDQRRWQARGADERLGRAGGRHPLDQDRAGAGAATRARSPRSPSIPRTSTARWSSALRDYVNRNRFPGVVLGLSGGIDSAICAAIAADALGPDRVWCVMLPEPLHQPGEPRRRHGMRRRLGCRYRYDPDLAGGRRVRRDARRHFADVEVDITEENIQSRIRGVTLMALRTSSGRCCSRPATRAR